MMQIMFLCYRRVCCSSQAEYRCSDCDSMVFCSRCNEFWHTKNSTHNVIGYLDDLESSEELKSNAAQSDYAEQEESVMESSGNSDFSFTGDDLDTTMQIEEMCHVGTLAEKVSSKECNHRVPEWKRYNCN